MRIRRSYLDRENGLPLLGGAVLSEGGKGRPRRGFKRLVVKLIDADAMVEAVVRLANEPEHTTLAHVSAVEAPARVAIRAKA